MLRHNREDERKRKRTDQSFLVPKVDIAANNYDLNINRYKEVTYEEARYMAPRKILLDLASLEAEVQAEIIELQEMIR
jgi:type I restriction enzyme M protein